MEQANIETVCKGDIGVWCAGHSVFTSHCESLCNASGPPHPPHCSVNGPTRIPKADPIVITVTLKDVCGFPVTNQSHCLKIQSQNVKDTKVKEHTHGSLSYLLSSKKEEESQYKYNM